MLKSIPLPSAWFLEILVIVGEVIIGFILLIASGVLTVALTMPLWKKVESFHIPSIKKEIFSKACKHLRDYYQLQEPYIITKCFEATDKNFRNHDVCIFIVGDELRITTDLIQGFLHGERDLGCYAFKKEEITLSKHNDGNHLMAELKANKIVFLLGYRAKGFIAILKDINNTQNGLVLLRRGRVIVGAETDGRYFPKSIFGAQGNFRFKRLFGELELDGFEVSFNKNDIQDKENLEALMEALKGEIHTREFDLYTQAEDYRVDENRKIVKKLVKRHNTSTKADRKPIDIFTPKPVQGTLPVVEIPVVKEPTVLDGFEDTYKIKETSYTLSLQYVEGAGDDLCWVDVSNKSGHEIICKIDVNHIFFQHFGKPTDAITAILKTIAIAKFTAKEQGNDTAGELLTYFNQYIKETKV